MRPRTAAADAGDLADFTEEVRLVFAELGRAFPNLLGECSPAIDVYETDNNLEVRVDLPGVDLRAIRVLVKGNALLIAGEKGARRGQGESSFHLVERGFGRFARTIRLSAPFDPNRTRATLVDGELRVTLPKIQDRRNRVFPIQIETTPDRKPS